MPCLVPYPSSGFHVIPFLSQEVERKHVIPAMFREVYSKIKVSSGFVPFPARRSFSIFLIVMFLLFDWSFVRFLD